MFFSEKFCVREAFLHILLQMALRIFFSSSSFSGDVPIGTVSQSGKGRAKEVLGEKSGESRG